MQAEKTALFDSAKCLQRQKAALEGANERAAAEIERLKSQLRESGAESNNQKVRSALLDESGTLSTAW